MGDPAVVVYECFDERPSKLEVRNDWDSKLCGLSSYDILITQDESRLSFFLMARYVDDEFDLFTG